MYFLDEFIGGLHITGGSIAGLILFLVVVFVAVTSVVLFFHWRRYGINKVLFAVVEVVYLGVCVVSISTAFFSIS